MTKIKKKTNNNIVTFPSKMNDGEREIEAIVFAAGSAPFIPIDVPPDATACHECDAVPGTQVAVLTPAVGTSQLTSPTSVEP